MKDETLLALEQYLERIERLHLVGKAKKPRQPDESDSHFLSAILQGQKRQNNHRLILTVAALLVLLAIAQWAVLHAESTVLDVVLSVAVESFFFLLGLWQAAPLVRKNEVKSAILQTLMSLEPEEAAEYVEWLYKFSRKKRR